MRRTIVIELCPQLDEEIKRFYGSNRQLSRFKGIQCNKVELCTKNNQMPYLQVVRMKPNWTRTSVADKGWIQRAFPRSIWPSLSMSVKFVTKAGLTIFLYPVGFQFWPCAVAFPFNVKSMLKRVQIGSSDFSKALLYSSRGNIMEKGFLTNRRFCLCKRF